MKLSMPFVGRKLTFLQLVRRDRAWLVMISLPFLWYVIFCYTPMFGIVIAFKDFRVSKGIFQSDWVGFRWFLQFFNSIFFWRLVRNTLLLNVYGIIFHFPVTILFALLVNEMRGVVWKRTVQTVSYLPYFISSVIVVGMLVNFFSPNDGIVNTVIKSLGGEMVDFLADPKWFRFLYVGSNVWQYFGFSSIIYLAAMAGINEELYDAAQVDGATRPQRIWHITLPGIAPTVTIMLLLNLGSLLSVGFEKIILMYTPTNYEASDVIATYVYRQGIVSGQFGFAAAVGLFNSVANLILLVLFNRVARVFSETTLW